MLYLPEGQARYFSSNPSVASVGATGNIIVNSFGTATVTAFYGGFSSQCIVSTLPFHTVGLIGNIAEWNRLRQSGVQVVSPGIGGVPNAVLDDSDWDHVHWDIVSSDLSDLDFCGTDLKGVDLSYNFLRGSRFTDADMTGVSLQHTRVFGANFDNAILSNADLQGSAFSLTSFRNANLSHANLTGASFQTTNCCGARFDGCRLNKTEFHHAPLIQASFRGAYFGETILDDCCLLGIEGLEEVAHEGNSFLDLRSLVQPDVKIPKSFLKGIGISQDQIEHLCQSGFLRDPFHSCFISYSRANKEFVRHLYDALSSRGVRCLLDEKDFKIGDKLHTRITNAIEESAKMLLCTSKQSLNSWWVDHEITAALQKEQEYFQKHLSERLVLIPVMIDDYLFAGTWNSGWKPQIKSRLAADFRNWQQKADIFQSGVDVIINALRIH